MSKEQAVAVGRAACISTSWPEQGTQKAYSRATGEELGLAQLTGFLYNHRLRTVLIKKKKILHICVSEITRTLI